MSRLTNDDYHTLGMAVGMLDCFALLKNELLPHQVAAIKETAAKLRDISNRLCGNDQMEKKNAD